MPTEHWYVFLSIEADLEQTARFVEPREANDACFSVEFARILMAAASEAEVSAKLLSAEIESQTVVDGIETWRTILTGRYPSLHTMRVFVPRAGRTLELWSEWGSGRNPPWWSAHNRIKHDRHLQFQEANLKNAMNAVAGLFCLQLYLHRNEYQKASLEPFCHLLSLHGHYEPIYTGAGGKLPDFP
jgi:hypothetical protein